MGDQQHEWKKDAVLSLPRGSQLVVWKEDGAVQRPWLFVEVGGQKLAFILNYTISEDFRHNSVHHLEMKSDLGLYLDRADPQPSGFPLRSEKDADQT